MGSIAARHPLDPLSVDEIKTAAQICKDGSKTTLAFNTITLLDPPKAELIAYYDGKTKLPDRKAFVIAFESGTVRLSEGVVNITTANIDSWSSRKDVMPTITLEDLTATEDIVRCDTRVIELCREIGIDDMSKVYCDAWTIGYDERWGTTIRLQQALMYYRVTPHDNQYCHPLDIIPIVDTQLGKVIAIDMKQTVDGKPDGRARVPMAQHNYMPEFIDSYRKDVKPINTTQPDGVSFDIQGNTLSWLGWHLHVGFNAREGIVLNNIRVDDPDTGEQRSLFHRLSIAEMVVPYGNPTPQHHRKMAFDVGEYGMGLMTNSLSLGCDCKGAIHYLDGVISDRAGEAPIVIKNAVCIHEEDSGILFKHTDFRDENVIVTRGRKLVISQVFTAANYEYCIYWTLHSSMQIELEVRLTGMLNTYVLGEGEEAGRYGTEVADRVIAHNHQHLFCLRIDPAIDGHANTVVQCDAVASDAEVGSPQNLFGNAFYSKRTTFDRSSQAVADYCHETGRTWDICNLDRLNPACKKPVAWKLVSREAATLLPKPKSLVWKRAVFARHSMHVTRYADDRLYPAGMYVPQTSGEAIAHNPGLGEWLAEDEDIRQQDIILWHTFGVTHMPRCEDFPIMPAEDVKVLLKAYNMFERNPAMRMPPSYATFGPGGQVIDARDQHSVSATESAGQCCS